MRVGIYLFHHQLCFNCTFGNLMRALRSRAPSCKTRNVAKNTRPSFSHVQESGPNKLSVALLICINHLVQSLGQFKVPHENRNNDTYMYIHVGSVSPLQKKCHSERSFWSCFWSGIETWVLAGSKWWWSLGKSSWSSPLFPTYPNFIDLSLEGIVHAFSFSFRTDLLNVLLLEPGRSKFFHFRKKKQQLNHVIELIYMHTRLNFVTNGLFIAQRGSRFRLHCAIWVQNQ